MQNPRCACGGQETGCRFVQRFTQRPQTASSVFKQEQLICRAREVYALHSLLPAVDIQTPQQDSAQTQQDSGPQTHGHAKQRQHTWGKAFMRSSSSSSRTTSCLCNSFTFFLNWRRLPSPDRSKSLSFFAISCQDFKCRERLCELGGNKMVARNSRSILGRNRP